MTDKNIQIQNTSGDNLYPKTNASLVYNNDSEDLGDVEAGAQVNIIETINVNGEALSIVNKAVDITIDSQSEYTVAKASTADDGYSSTYYLTKDGSQVGEKINIPKDLVVESGSVETVETADSPVEGYVVGDKYIDLVLANSDDAHIYVLVSDLVDTYTAGDGITITGNVISVDTSAIDISSKQDVITGAATTITTADLTVSRVLISNTSGKVAVSDITTTELGYLDGVTSNIQTQLDAKADSATTLAGYGITDALTYAELA